MSVSVGFILRITKLKNLIFSIFPLCPLNVSQMFQLHPVFHGAPNIVILFPRHVSLKLVVTKLLPNWPYSPDSLNQHSTEKGDMYKLS